MKRILTSFFILTIVTLLCAAQEQPQLGIVNRTQCTGFWRYDFNYQTTDSDGETPIVLSAAIFLSTKFHEKTDAAKGLALMNHYTITNDAERPTNVTGQFSLEGFIQGSGFIIIESDGIGFGQTVDRQQNYLKGRTTARIDIDAFIAGRELLRQEGIGFGNLVANLGYSQGGHGGMWVNRLVAEGYRSDELPKIDYCIIGGGPYDMYSQLNGMFGEGVSYYPVAIPLILNSIIDNSDALNYNDVFRPEFVEKIPEWFDSKKYKTAEINNLIYQTFGGSAETGIQMSAILTDEFINPESAAQKAAGEWLKENSLVYDDWSPIATDHIVFFHSHDDEVVPYVNMESMNQFLTNQGYTNYEIKDVSGKGHTDTGMYYAMQAKSLLTAFEPVGAVESIDAETSNDTPVDVYTIDGCLLMRQVSPRDAYNRLSRGVYIIGNKKVVK